MDLSPRHADCADDVDGLIRRVYGDVHLGTGVLHPTSVWRPDGEDSDLQLALRLGPAAPSSEWDAFALSLARARADAILTTGRVLRAEPDLRHVPMGPAGLPAALDAWRRRQGKGRPPISLVLTEGGEIDFTHPLFRGPGRVVIYTGRAAAWRLESRAADAGVEMEAVDEPTPEGAVTFLRAAFGAATVSIEAGPSVARRLYDDPLVIDEVLLSTFLGSHLPTAARGGRQPPRDRLESLFRRPRPPLIVEQDGGWRFERLVRRHAL